MTKKKALISQPFGLGDVIFSMAIANHFIKNGYEVIWPVLKHFYDGLTRAYPKIHFKPFEFGDANSPYHNIISNVKTKHVFFDIESDWEVVPIRWSDSYMKLPYKDVMKAKYLMYDLDWKIWKKHARWARHYRKEKELMEFLGIQPGEQYNLINKRFGNGREVPITVDNGLKNIYMTDVISFSLFDWAGTIENATNLHMVSTATLYMVEVLNLQCKENHLYKRHPIERDLSYVTPLLSKEYILHE